MPRWPLSAIATALLSVEITVQAQPAALEEVIVTARHREESAQATPLSLVALGDSQLEQLGISSIGDLQALVPNLNLDAFPANNQTLRLFIRGVGLSDVQITQDPAVGVYLNGIYIARSTGLAFDLPDLERIEVLRGAQGTLYGRNTTGGAINLISRKPDPESLSLRQDFTAGNRDLWRSRTSLNLPLGDRLAARIAYLRDTRNGFISNTGAGGGFGDRNSEGARVDLRYWPVENLILDYAWDRSRVESYNYTPQAHYPAPPRGGLIDLIGISARRFVPYSETRLDALATSVALLPTDIDIEGHTLQAEYHRGDYTLRSLTGWRDLEESSYIDFASGASQEYRVDFNAATLAADSETPITFPAVRPLISHEQLSQEFQWLGPITADMTFLLGLYYFEERASEENSPQHHLFSAPLGRERYPTVVNIREEKNDIENSATAIYGQLNWTPDLAGSKLQFGFGLRYSRDRRKVERDVSERTLADNGDTATDLIPGVVFAAGGDRRFEDTSVSFSAGYDWRDNLHTFVKYVEAYRSGGYNVRDPDPDAFSAGFDDEKIHSIEAGFKGEMLQRSLRLNTTVFYSEYRDYQLNFQIPGTISGTRVFNTGSASLSGAELELSFIPHSAWLLSINYAYLDAHIEPTINPLDGEPTVFHFTNAPRNTASAMVNYTRPAWADAQWQVSISYQFTDDRQRHNLDTRRDAYQLLGARVGIYGLRDPIGQWQLSVWGKNILDEDYVTFAIDNLPHAGRATLWGEPRSYGVDLTWRYH